MRPHTFLFPGLAFLLLSAGCASLGPSIGECANYMLIGAAGGGAVGVIGVDEVLGDSVSANRRAAAGVVGAVAGASVGYALCARAYRQKRDLEERFARVEAELAEARAQNEAEATDPHRPAEEATRDAVEFPAPRPEVVRDQIVRLELGSTLLFETDGDVLSARARPYLDALASSLRENLGSEVALVGHTDTVGAEDYNRMLSERRARAVADFLIARGVAQERLHVAGRGEAEPIATNDTAEGRAQNRRVEVLIVPQTQTI